MNLLRRLPLSRLLALCAVAVITVAGVALAATGAARRTPPKVSTATAIREALAAKAVPGITATISFSDSLLGAAGIAAHGQPLLSTGTGRAWVDAGGRVRLELQSDRGDTEIYAEHGKVSFFDGSTRTLYRLILPPDKSAPSGPSPSKPHTLPNVAQIQTALQALMVHAGVSAAQPTNVAGQPAYRLQLTPHNGGLLSGVGLWWDATHGTPLKLAVYAQGQAAPVLQLEATNIRYQAVKASAFTAPSAAKTVDLNVPAMASSARRAARAAKGARGARAVSVATLQAALPFVSAPASLAGMPRTGTQLLQWNGHQAALVQYGQGLGGIVVLEQQVQAESKAKPSPDTSQGDGQNQGLPPVKVNGAPGTMLSTPLGTFLQFTRSQVRFVVAGSVRASVALAAANGL